MAAAPRLVVGDERMRAFLEDVGRRLRAPEVARRHPELASLGFFLRRSELERAAGLPRGDEPRQTGAAGAGEFLRVPRGLVFHVAPANVDTVFVYSWALSALMGNRNVVRLSARAGGAAEAILDIMRQALDDADPVVARTQRIVSYEHHRAAPRKSHAEPFSKQLERPTAADQALDHRQTDSTNHASVDHSQSDHDRHDSGKQPRTGSVSHPQPVASTAPGPGNAAGPTAVLSAACDLRVIWGGDRTVNEIRRHPLAPHALDLAFPDRSSFAVIRARAWLEATPATREAVADGFAVDAYWFDQAACSSPGTVFWVGSPTECHVARDGFAACLAEAVARRGWTVDTAMAVEKRVAAYGLAADGVADAVEFRGNVLAQVILTTPGVAPRRWLGTGTFAHARLSSLDELADVVRRKDQTLTHFGFAREELAGLARALGGRGLDRIVPIGKALGFHRVWDGVDLPAEFSRLVTIQ
ncbi:gamma-glutamyl phosphate reductase [Nonomuraea sp. SMC257]|uniref:Gamma-glutamyl phosphate reductase n=2 Tax=Nonomuraea montanisoli TaxID=2741721 RepID=A0A7Y6I297_9ACTN|nr:gamma-glutamyl phosphate reductase [Nonomuraea montanisoli]